MRTNYMMTVDDVMEELGVKRSKAYGRTTGAGRYPDADGT